MRLLFVADGRSPIALNWIRYWIDRGDEVHLVSTFTCEQKLPLASLEYVPVAFSSVKGTSLRPISQNRNLLWGAASLGLRTRLRQWLGPLTINRAAQRLRKIIQHLHPDLVHAMRIPYEGMLAADAYTGVPLVVSVWGNDFTLHASSSPLMRHYTEWAVKITNGLHADCYRDLRLAKQLGFPSDRPTLVVPGNGGIDRDVFFPPTKKMLPLVINPRGFRNYVCNDTFFQAIPIVLKRSPDVHFVCPSMAGEPQAKHWLKELEVEQIVELLPFQTRLQMAEWYRKAQVLVSPSTHDGTPNSLLEGMACGCFPVAGDIESLREWITPGLNGLLIDPRDPQSLAEAILQALEDSDLRARAENHNTDLIAERAEYTHCMRRAEAFYNQILS